MPLTILAIIVGAIVGVAAGGRPRYLAARRIRSWGLLPAGAVLEAAGKRWPLGGASTEALVAGYLLLLVFAGRNALLAGMGVVAIGLLANLAVVASDAGMPVSPSAVISAGIASPGKVRSVDYGFGHHLQRRSDHLTFLADRLPLAPLGQVISVGDLVLALGVADVTGRLLMPTGRHAPKASGARRRHTRGALEVAVESVEHRTGGGFLPRSAGGQAAAHLPSHRVVKYDQSPSPQLGGEGMHRHQPKGHRESEIGQGSDDRLSDRAVVSSASFDPHVAPPVVEV